VLDAFIIDEIKRREVEEQDDAGRPRLEIPEPGDEPEPVETDDGPGAPAKDEKEERVVVIDL
jgi:hypothetical protein